jgi:Ca-activated chloride channel family protein
MVAFGLRYHGFSFRADFRLSIFLCLAILVFPLRARSQSEEQVHVALRNPPAQPVAEADTLPIKGEPTLDAHLKPLRVDVDLVQVPVTVTDAMNHPVLGLGKQNFELYERDQLQQIRYFSAEDAPVSVGLILDLSKSMTNKIETERAAVAQFFQNANPADDYFIIAVSDRPKLIATSTQSIGTIQAKLALEVPDGNTALLDAIYMGEAQMRRARYQRRALLIISDGGDNNSRYRLREIKDIVRETDVEIYAIGTFDTALFKTFEEYMGKKWLGEITDATGGRTITVDNLASLPEAAASISWELRHQYVLAYHPSNNTRDGKLRKIKVRVTPSTSATPRRAHYRTNYRAPTE